MAGAFGFKTIHAFGDFLQRLPGSPSLIENKFKDGDIVYCYGNQQLYRIGAMGDYSKGAIVTITEEEVSVPSGEYDDSLFYKAGNKFYYWDGAVFNEFKGSSTSSGGTGTGDGSGSGSGEGGDDSGPGEGGGGTTGTIDSSKVILNSSSGSTAAQTISTPLSLTGAVSVTGQFNLGSSSGLTSEGTVRLNGGFEVGKNSSYNIAGDIYSSGSGAEKKIVVSRPLYLGSTNYYFDSSGTANLKSLTVDSLDFGDGLKINSQTTEGDYLRLSYEVAEGETVGVLTTKDISTTIPSTNPSDKKVASEAAVKKAIDAISTSGGGSPYIRKAASTATSDADKLKFLIDTADNDILKYYDGTNWVPVVVAWG